MLTPMIMKLHRYIDHEWQMNPIDFQMNLLFNCSLACFLCVGCFTLLLAIPVGACTYKGKLYGHDSSFKDGY
ncbi:hypothetical protein DPMN_077902 [Dreissena polymorpha]|uniref:Uncharacterized protein n=1 Tax=Dreissena polymorpha TaxID=45954 RepID=A0A9D3YQ53_DREPO|nr:hypothetical protein DPMN_077902 [Dreissena polymorpha]